MHLLSLNLDARSDTFGEPFIEADFNVVLRRADDVDLNFKPIQVINALLRAEPRDLEELGYRYDRNGIVEDDETTAKAEEKVEAAVARLSLFQAFFELSLVKREDTDHEWETAQIPDEIGLYFCNIILCEEYGCSSAPPSRKCKNATARGETK